MTAAEGFSSTLVDVCINLDQENMDYSLWAWNLSGSEKEFTVSSPFSVLACLPSESSLVPWCMKLSHSDVGSITCAHTFTSGGEELGKPSPSFTASGKSSP